MYVVILILPEFSLALFRHVLIFIKYLTYFYSHFFWFVLIFNVFIIKYVGSTSPIHVVKSFAAEFEKIFWIIKLYFFFDDQTSTLYVLYSTKIFKSPWSFLHFGIWVHLQKKKSFFFFFEILPFHYNDKYRITFARYFDLTTNIQIRYMYFSCWRGTFNSKIRLCLFTIPNESFFFLFFFLIILFIFNMQLQSNEIYTNI